MTASSRVLLTVPRHLCCRQGAATSNHHAGHKRMIMMMIRRSLMDVHTRPSHSRMISRPGNPNNSPTTYSGESPHHPHPTTDLSSLSSYSYSYSSLPMEIWSFGYWSLLVRRAVMASCIVYCLTEYVANITVCEGPSMLPTIQPDGTEIVCIDRWHPRRLGLDGGCSGEERAKRARQRQAEFEQQQKKQRQTKDHDLDEWHEPWISVSDLPMPSWRQALKQMQSPISVGDVVVVQHPSRKGSVCKRVLGLPGDQVLLNNNFNTRGSLRVVPDGHVWLEGDNPANSADSRHYGAVPASLILGRVLARIWPLRGQAWMKRGGRPRQQGELLVPSPAHSYSGSTVLPAGYEGQHIRKPLVKEDQSNT